MKILRKKHSIALALLAFAATALQAQQPAIVSGAQAQHVGNDLVLTFDLDLSQLNLKSTQTRVYTPVVQTPDGQQMAFFRPVMVNGRRQHIMYQRGAMTTQYPDAQELQLKKGMAPLHYVATVPYEQWMRAYDVRLSEDVCGCGDLLSQQQTPLLQKRLPAPVAPWLTIVPAVNERKARQLEGKAYLDFPVNKTVIYPDYRRNPEELAKIVATIDEVRQNKDVVLDAISIHGYASPEGSFANNTRLAAGRAEALRQYVKRLFSFDDRIVSETSTPEDWAGLRAYVDASQMEQRAELLAVIDSDLEPDARDAQLKRQFPSQYAFLLKEVYPALRHSDYVVQYTIRPFDFEESKAIYRERPEDLSTYEIYRLAEDDGLDTPAGREKLFTAARLYPADSQAQLLAAQAALQQGDNARAASYAQQAGTSPQASYVLGAIALRQADYAAAERHMQQALQGGVADAQQVLDIISEYK